MVNFVTALTIQYWKVNVCFFLFDFTHNFKNIYNNFVNKQRMHPPILGHERVLGKSCVAEFAHIKHLYALEEGKPIKITHALKKSSS